MIIPVYNPGAPFPGLLKAHAEFLQAARAFSDMCIPRPDRGRHVSHVGETIEGIVGAFGTRTRNQFSCSEPKALHYEATHVRNDGTGHLLKGLEG